MSLIRLVEASGTSLVSMPISVASELASRQVASLSPTGSGEWRVANVSKVGVVRIDAHDIVIEPKVPLRRLFYLLSRSQSWGDWFDDVVGLDSAQEVYPAIAEAFALWAERVLHAGVVRGYRVERNAEAAIRGRIVVAEQVRTRFGMALPIELEYDEYTIDVPENQVVRAACRRLLSNGRLAPAITARLRKIDREFAGVSVLTRGLPLPSIVFDRRNEGYRPVLGLAELILTNGSLDHRVGSNVAAGFLLDIPKIFEDFVESEVRRAISPHGGRICAQDSRNFDRDGRATVRPDLVWRRDGAVVAVLDAKYKAEKNDRFPNADLYQMLAYCVRHELLTGHLVYAAGNEVPRDYVISEAGVTIRCHALELDAEPDEIARQIDDIVANVA